MTHAPKYAALRFYVKGELSPAAEERLLAHLEGCEVCQDACLRVEAAESLVEEMRGDTSEVEDKPMPMALLAEARRIRRGRHLRRAGFVVAAAAAAALFVRLGGPATPTEAPVAEAPSTSSAPAAPEVAPDVPSPAVVAEALVTPSPELIEGTEWVVGGSPLFIRLGEGTGIRLGPGSRLVATRLREDGIRLRLEAGRVDAQVRTGQAFRVDAGAYGVEVRGTRFSVAVVQGVVDVSVTEGLVAVLSADGERMLPAGEHARFGGEGSAEAPELEVLAPTPSWLSGTGRTVTLPTSTAVTADFPGLGMLSLREPVTVALPVDLREFAWVDARGRRTSVAVPEGPLEAWTLPAPPTPARAGTLASEAIRPVMRRASTSFRRCYERALRVHPEARVDGRLRIVIAPDGSVRRARVSGSPANTVTRCIESVASGLTFPRPSGGPVTFDMPLTLRPR